MLAVQSVALIVLSHNMAIERVGWSSIQAAIFNLHVLNDHRGFTGDSHGLQHPLILLRLSDGLPSERVCQTLLHLNRLLVPAGRRRLNHSRHVVDRSAMVKVLKVHVVDAIVVPVLLL